MQNKVKDTSLQQLINKFTEVSEDTIKLNEIIQNFNEIMDDYQKTLTDIEEKVQVLKLDELSTEAIKKLELVKALNEQQVFNVLKKALTDSLDEQKKDIEKILIDSLEKQKKEMKKNTLDQSKSKKDGLLEQIQSISKSIAEIKSNTEQSTNYEELTTILTRVEQQMKYPTMMPPYGYSNGGGSEQEVRYLKTRIRKLERKIEEMEEDYSYRVDEMDEKYALRIEQLERKVRQLMHDRDGFFDGFVAIEDDEDLPI